MEKRFYSILIMIVLLLGGCAAPEPEDSIIVTLIADGREQVYAYDTPITVGEFLQRINFEYNPAQDRVNPPEFTQITNGMRVTVVRVTETTECEQVEIPYRQTNVPNEGLQPGEQRLARAGQNGVEELCYRLRLEDGEARDRTQISRTVLVEPQDEILYVGPTGELEPVPISGTLAYISRGNVWVIQGSSTTKRALTVTSDLDGHVFSLAPNGRQLIFTRSASNPAEGDALFLNELWYIADITSGTEPIRLAPGDILYADWVPGQENTISYSTAQAREAPPGWLAFNDLYIVRIDPLNGVVLNVEQILGQSGGLYSWWGSEFQWSPDGTQLAIIRADYLGLVNFETGEVVRLLQYEPFRTFQDWSWRATASWSADGQLIATTVHGAPLSTDQPADTSPVFNIAITDSVGSFQAELISGAGMWASPRFSPIFTVPDSEFPRGYVAYLRARVPFESVNGEYDLYVADRDGSNARRLFPPPNAAGLRAQEFAADFNWSPDGRQLAVIYQGNLWVVDVQTGIASQLTLDGGASKPVWMP